MGNPYPMKTNLAYVYGLQEPEGVAYFGKSCAFFKVYVQFLLVPMCVKVIPNQCHTCIYGFQLLDKTAPGGVIDRVGNTYAHS